MANTRQFPHEPLTEREREIVELIADGLNNQQIASRLYLTLDTVKWYNRQIFQKMGVHSRTQAIAVARTWGLLSKPPGDPSAAPTHQTKHNLPVQSTVFVGRAEELAGIHRRLADPACRLLTLFGPGGIGKTRLAIEAGRQQSRAFADGVFFVPFASVESASFVAPTLASALGLAQTDQRDTLEQVVNYLREKTVLLLLDNFEHLREGVDLLSEVLAKAQAAKLLVTSRERLQLKEEWVFDVQGLYYPAEQAREHERNAGVDYAAGQLFVWTAQRARSDFVPDETDRLHIARICRLVGGMPLAIELAASWVRLLSCTEIAREIVQGLDILTTAWRDVPQRHRSIQAVLDHSWKLLATGEQDVFRRLTVFSGSFGREAAAAVADASTTLLLALVDKSFLRRTDPDRFGIHELIKQFGGGKLQADPELWAATRLRHCRYFATYLVERMNAPDASRHLGDVEIVFDDIQMAWRYAVENCNLVQIHDLAQGFLFYYGLHSWYRAGSGALVLYQRALACYDPATKDPDRQATISYLYESAGSLQKLATAYEAALAAFHKALETTAEHDYIRRGRLYRKLADVWVAMNQLERGHEVYALAEAELAQAPQQVAAWWNEWLRIAMQRMELYYWENRPDAMAELAHQIDPVLEQHGSVMQRMRYLNLLGMMALRRDRYYYSSDAITYTGEALALSLETGNLSEIAVRRFYHGFSHLWSDHLDEAETHLQIVRKMTQQNGDLTLLARAITYLTLVYRKQGDGERVREFAAQTLSVAAEAKMPQYTGTAHAHLAWLAWRAGDMAETKRQAWKAIEEWGGLGEAQSVVAYRWYVLFPLLGVALQEENVADAVQWAQHMIESSQFRLPDDLTALLARAVAARENGQENEARELLRQALQLAHELHYI